MAEVIPKRCRVEGKFEAETMPLRGRGDCEAGRGVSRPSRILGEASLRPGEAEARARRGRGEAETRPIRGRCDVDVRRRKVRVEVSVMPNEAEAADETRRRRG